jgi:mannose-6-phosphate isomerase-like protein (cupin superfamily)
MQRKKFLQLSLLTPLLSATGINTKKERPTKGFKVAAGKDRFQEELHIMGGQFQLMVSSEDTNGDLCIYNTIRQEKGGPPLHLHHEQDEWFYVLKGEFIVKVGDETFTLSPGDSAFAPRTIPHAFAKVNEGEAQMLVQFQPAGSMEDFFKEMSKLGSNIPTSEQLKNLWESHGMTMVGPPLKF